MKTDAQVQHDVLAELKWEPSVDAALIGVTVQDGIVTLGGTVSSFTQKWDAERVAQRFSHVLGRTISAGKHKELTRTAAQQTGQSPPHREHGSNLESQQDAAKTWPSKYMLCRLQA